MLKPTPIDLQTCHAPLLTVELNGKDPFTFIVDTGCSTTNLTEA